VVVRVQADGSRPGDRRNPHARQGDAQRRVAQEKDERHEGEAPQRQAAAGDGAGRRSARVGIGNGVSGAGGGWQHPAQAEPSEHAQRRVTQPQAQSVAQRITITLSEGTH
jgi:hypothetical protein